MPLSFCEEGDSAVRSGSQILVLLRLRRAFWLACGRVAVENAQHTVLRVVENNIPLQRGNLNGHGTRPFLIQGHEHMLDLLLREPRASLGDDRVCNLSAINAVEI